MRRPPTASLRPDQLALIEEAYAEVGRTRKGRLLILGGASGAGRTTLLAEAIQRLAARRPRPQIIAGGFDVPGSRGALVASRVPMSAPELPEILAALGQVTALAAAGLALSEPTGAVRTANAVATLLGQGTQSAGAVLQLGRKHSTSPSFRLGSPNELVRALASQVSRTSDAAAFVLCLDDIDAAVPPAAWSGLFLRRLLPALVSGAPVLVLVSTSSSEALRDGMSAAEIAGELLDRDLADLVPVDALTVEDIKRWLGDAEPGLVEDLDACAGGSAGWTKEIFARWCDAGVVRREAGVWRYVVDADRGFPQHAADYARADLAQWLSQHASDPLSAFDRASKILQLAALEGPTFTVQALARAAGEPIDDLSDWIDETLLSDDEPRSPLVDAGFVSIDLGSDRRSVYRYEFRNRLTWLAFHPLYSRSASRDTTRWPEQCGVYASALAATYGVYSSEIVTDVVRLCALAGRPDDARRYARAVNSLVSLEIYDAILDQDLADIQQDAQGAYVSLATLRRLVATVQELYRTRPLDRMVDGLRAALAIAEELSPHGATTDALASHDVARERESVLVLLQNIATALEWVGDNLRCAELAYQSHRRRRSSRWVEQRIAVAGSLWQLAESIMEPEFDGRLGTRLNLVVPTIESLLIAPSQDRDARSRQRENLLAAANKILSETKPALGRVPSQARDHARGHWHFCAAEIHRITGATEKARQELERAIRYLDRDGRRSCRERYLARTKLGILLIHAGDRQQGGVLIHHAVGMALEVGDLTQVVSFLNVRVWGRLAASFEEGVSLGFHAIVLGRQVGDTSWEASLWASMAEWAAADGRLNTAVRLLAVSERIGHQKPDCTVPTARSWGVEDAVVEQARRWAARHPPEDGGLTYLKALMPDQLVDTDAFLATIAIDA